MTAGRTVTERIGRLPALRVASALTVLCLLWQFVTAGQLFPGGAAVQWHAAGAIALHVVSGVSALAALARWWSAADPWWPGVLAALVFVLSFVQAYDGNRAHLWIHVPGAMVLTVGAVWVLVWSLQPSARA